MRVGIIAVVCASIIGTALADEARAAIRKSTNVAAQDLAAALKTFAQDRNLYLIYATQDLHNLETAGVSGELTSDEALKQLLSGSGLTYRFIDETTVTIMPVATAAPSQTPSGTDAPQETPAPPAERASNDPSRGSGSLADTGPSVEEIVVTAQKRLERLQDVPVPVTAVTADSLVDNNQLRLSDYYTRIPGLSVTPGTQSTQVVSIRGITTGRGNPTVGIVIDDVPFGASAALGGGQVVPDIDPGDLARVEVLRGPQGTLYGASSMGGLFKFVTRDPSTDGISGRIQAGVSSVHRGDELGYNVRGAINLPLGEELAMRASAFTRRDAGYIDNPVLGIDGVNKADAEGGRVSLLWRPWEAISFKLSALLQQIEAEGSSYTYRQPGMNDFEQNSPPSIGGYDRQVEAYSATISVDLGSVDITSVTGYNINSFTDSFDAAYIYSAAVAPLFGVTGAGIFNDNETHKLSQEIRLSGPLGERFEWLLGGFYTDEDSGFLQEIQAVNPLTGTAVGRYQSFDFPTTFREYAAFGDLTFHFTDRFDVQIGGRQSSIRQTFTQTAINPQGVATLTPEQESDADVFTFLVTPRLRLSSDLMLYARLASGYRAGGSNAGTNVPLQYEPDETRNYEIGLKSELFDRRLALDASVFLIEWTDIQLLATNAQSIAYTANGSRARSRGVELAVDARPLPGLAIAGWVTWSDAELAEDLPASGTAFAYGLSGDRLPWGSRFSGNLAFDGEFPLTSTVTGLLGSTVSYVGNRLGVFRPVSAPQRQNFPGYAQIDAHAGIRYAAWTANLFVNNLADRRGVLWGGLGAQPPFGFTYTQPRTIGLSIGRTW
jgi:iron complex outermembrane recepter protein